MANGDTNTIDPSADGHLRLLVRNPGTGKYIPYNLPFSVIADTAQAALDARNSQIVDIATQAALAAVQADPVSGGTVGPKGADGTDGENAYQLAVTAGGFEGTMLDWLESLRGPAGNAGAPGTNGPQGAQGVAGVIGPKGENGETGSVGATGPTGPQGNQGLPGAAGAKGDTGATGLTGGVGPTGATGATGPAGSQGVPGIPGTNATTTALATGTAAGLMPSVAVTQLAGLPAVFDKVYIEGVAATSPKIAKRTVTSGSDGSFTCTFSTEGFISTVAPGCTAQAQATTGGLANTVNATTLPPTYTAGAWTITGWVTAPNTQTLLGLSVTAPVKVAPGVTVIITAIGN